MSEIAFFILGQFPCSIWRHGELGHLCGYLGVPPKHPWWGQFGPGRSWENRGIDEPDAHGGITYAAPENFYWETTERSKQSLKEWSESGKGIPDGPAVIFEWTLLPSKKAYPHDTGLSIWWVGFDCAHLGDVIPGLGLQDDGVYRDESYVRAELENLARQAAEATMQEVPQ